MIPLTAASAAWLGAVAAALAVLAVPTVIALVRGAQYPGLVILLTVLGFTWPLAFIAAFALPRRLPPPRPRMPGYPPAPAPVPGRRDTWGRSRAS